MLATFDQLGSALTKNADVAFGKGYVTIPNEARSIWSVKYVTAKNTESDTYSNDKIASDTGEGQNYAVSDPVKGYALQLTQGKITNSFEVTKEAGKYGKYNVVDALKGTEDLAGSCAKRIEMDLQLHIGMGAGSSYQNKDGNTVSTLAADGVNLFHASGHTVRSGATYGNLISTAFGKTGLEEAELKVRNMINHDGQQVDKAFDVIFSTKNPSLTGLITEYLNSTGHVADSSRGINTYSMSRQGGQAGGKYRHVAMQYLDSDVNGAADSAKDDYWGIAASGDEELQLEVSQDPVVYPPQLITRNRNALIQADAHYAYGVRNAYCIVLSNA